MRRRSIRAQRSIGGLILAAALLALPTTASAADYSFTTDGTPEYYSSTSYEDVYDAQYNYGGPNAVDYQIPELEYGQFSTTQTGVMEKALLLYPHYRGQWLHEADPRSDALGPAPQSGRTVALRRLPDRGAPEHGSPGIGSPIR